MPPVARALLRRYRPIHWPPWIFPPPTRMAVAAYLVPQADPNNPGQYLPDWNGQPMDWNWVLQQWDRIAAAGSAVRLVVAEQSYTGLTGAQLAQIKSKLSACHKAGQLVYGYTYGNSGALPLGPVHTWWSVPRDPTTGQLSGAVMQVTATTAGAQLCVQDQIDAWRNAFPGIIDGIYVDVGPVDCLKPGTFGGSANIPGNYAQYCAYINSFGLQVFLLAPQYDDDDPNQPRWLRVLPWNFLGLWEQGCQTYDTKFNAWNVCANTYTSWPPGNPDASWWDPVRVGGIALQRMTRVHIINGGAQVHVSLGWIGEWFPSLQQFLDQIFTTINLYQLMQLAMSRGAATVWITEAGYKPTLGSVYDQLPPYWDDEVALCS